MYTCYLHGWSSHHEMCPNCITYTSSTDIVIRDPFNELQIELTKLKDMIIVLQNEVQVLREDLNRIDKYGSK